MSPKALKTRRTEPRKPSVFLVAAGFICLIAAGIAAFALYQSGSVSQFVQLGNVLLSLAVALVTYGISPVDVRDIASEINTPGGKIRVFGPVGVGLIMFLLLTKTTPIHAAAPSEPALRILENGNSDSSIVSDGQRLTLVATETFDFDQISETVKTIMTAIGHELPKDQRESTLKDGFEDLASHYLSLTASADLRKLIELALAGGTDDELREIDQRWKNLVSRRSAVRKPGSAPEDNDNVTPRITAAKQLDRMPFGLFRLQDGNKGTKYYLLTEKMTVPVGKKTFQLRFVYSLSRSIPNSPRAAVFVMQ